MEVVLRQVHATSALSEKRVVVAKPPARLIQLRSRQSRYPDTRELLLLQASQELIKPVQYRAVRRQKWIQSDVDRVSAADHGFVSREA